MSQPLGSRDCCGVEKTHPACQETLFSRMKSFKVIDEKFRHKPVMEKHKACFEAEAIIVQYGIDLGFPLFQM